MTPDDLHGAGAEETGALVERYLVSLIRPETRSYMARAGTAQRNVLALLAAMGNPHAGMRVIHVAGSKGKGSTALLLEALLQHAGLRTATFTSPHLERWTERFRIGGVETEAMLLADVFARLQPVVEQLAARDADTAPSFFEVLTAAAFVLFAEQGVDVAILECGLGGRYDATNVITPLVSVITGIEMEHVDKLGPALVDIARHKAGVVKPGVPLVCGRLPPVARAEIRDEAIRLRAPVVSLGAGFSVEAHTGENGLLTLALLLQGEALVVPTALRAPHLARNAALAFATALQSGLLSTDELSVLAPVALAAVSLPGRVEVLDTRPWLVVDGAHTLESVRELARTLSGLPASERVLLLSLSGEKSPLPMLQLLLQQVTRVVVTRAERLRSREPAAVAAEIRSVFPSLPLECIEAPEEAFDHARRVTPADGLLCAAGSMYVAGFVRRQVKNSPARRAAA